MFKRQFVKAALAGLMIAGPLSAPAAAQEVTLRMHQFLPPQATLPGMILDPWARSVEEASDGRIKIEHFYAMSLGGRPPELMDQARDGVVDIVMTLPGYTPGRFPSTEVFELPFMMTDPVATSKAYWELVDTDLQDTEFADVQVLGAWVHGPGMIHSKDTVASLEDMNGKTLRGPTRVINDLLSELGAEPVGMPVPAIPEALSKGVIGGTVIPWEVTPALRLTELVNSHTEFSGEEAFYTATFVLAMNKAKYDAMPDDLKAILNAESGEKFSAFASGIMLEMDAPARAKAEAAGNTIVTLDADEVARWKEASLPVIDRWTSEMDGKGKDGSGLVEKARALIEKHGG
ncbi:MAG: TRAP transporter substrate-binding protein [Pseudomonadota bacterium]